MTFVVACSFLMYSSTSFADGTGDLNVYTEDVVTKEEKKKHKEKEQKLKEWKEKKVKKEKGGDVSTLYLPDGYYKTLGVPSFEQQTDYWCGPATAKQVLHYINGSSSSQSTIAAGLNTEPAGTNFSIMDEYLDSKQSRTNYIYSEGNSYGTWSDRINYGLDHSYSVLLDLEIYPSYMPKYSRYIAGHILNVSGANSKYSSTPQIRLTDPFDEGNRGVTLGNVWHPHKGVYNANMSHFRQAIIW